MLILSTASTACRPQVASNFGVEKWAGTLLDGSRIRFSALPARGLVLNVYSPTCGPCIEELPALNELQKRAQVKNTPVYLIVDMRPKIHGLSKGARAGDSDLDYMRYRLKKDKKKYGIVPKIVIMDANFKVDPDAGLITGTPETLFFRTKPLRLTYNMVGPIANVSKSKYLQRDPRFQLALDQL